MQGHQYEYSITTMRKGVLSESIPEVIQFERYRTLTLNSYESLGGIIGQKHFFHESRTVPKKNRKETVKA